MKTLPPNTRAAQSADSFAAIEKDIQRLQREREKLLARREVLKHEAVQSLADAFARKLHAMGLTVREGIQALRPYERINLDESPPQPTRFVPNNTFRRASPPVSRKAAQPGARSTVPQQSIEELAQHVLGSDWDAWMSNPHPLLGGVPPNVLLGSPGSAARVRALLDAYHQSA